ncbi:17337_t:CDS:10 [Funneliformis geosporum]|uniref:17337_t:CDS:1 n=1 Tax=Funneliformis geosporum TaxID=1117311 RepID=A0A9W4WW07_9GLOM|nr:17337_t:CDS:10 [Funneliformis geosporum]
MKLEISFLVLFITSALSNPIFVRQEHKRNLDLQTNIFEHFLPLPKTNTPVSRYYDLVVSRTELAPDGCLTEAFTVNNQYPAPIIHVNKGDRIIAKVTNHLGPNEPTAMHWHGMFQRGTNWYDGVPGMVIENSTQCPIPNDVSFVYDFSTGKQSGTFWYHAHIRGQYAEGIRGPLIIHDPDDPYRDNYDYEYAVTLSDWYHDRIAELIEKRMAPSYGVGRYDCSAAPAGSKCQKDNPLAVYKFKSGKRYRLRLINTSAMAHFIFSIDSHPLMIIEADGSYTIPYTVNRLPIAIGQRYSVIVKADQKIDNYWIRASIDSRCILNTTETLNSNSAINYNVTGILRYIGAEKIEPTTTAFTEELPVCLGVPQNNLKLLKPEPVPGPVTDHILFNVTFGTDQFNISRAFINNSSFVGDINDPTIKKLATHEINSVAEIPLKANAYPLENPDGVVDITILNSNGGIHPFHLHGHIFYVLGTGPGLVVDESLLNLVDPFPRDVFSVNATSWARFRFKTNNPGVWSFHCHIEFHVEMGMIAQLVELPNELSKVQLPEPVLDLCEKYSSSNKPDSKKRSNNRLKVDMKVLKV